MKLVSSFYLYIIPRIKLSSSGNCFYWLRPLTASSPSHHLNSNSDSFILLISELCKQWLASVQVRATFIPGHLKSDLELSIHSVATSMGVGLSLSIDC